MSSFQSAIDEAMRAAEEMGAPSAPSAPSGGVGGIDIESLIAEANAAATEIPQEAKVSEFDQPDLQAGAVREMEGIVDVIPYSPWEPIPLREVARGAVGMYMDAANTLANPGMRAQFFRSLMRPAEWVAGMYDSITGAETDPAARELTARLLAERLSMALEPEGSGLTTADLPSEIVAMRGMAEGLASGQEEGIRGDIARGVGQSLPQFAALAATGGGSAPVAMAAQTLIPLSTYSQGMQEAIGDLEQERADAALAGEPLPVINLQDLRTRAEASAVINTAVEMGGAAIGGRAIGKIAKRMSDTPAGRGLSAALARTGAARAAERMAVTPATQAFRAITSGTNRITPGFLRGLRDIALTSGAEEAGEELVTGVLMAPFTYAPLGEDLSNALYSSMIGFGAGGVGGVGVTAGVKVKQAGANLYDSFRAESDADRIVRVAHSETLRKRIDFTADLEKAERDRIAVSLESMNGMTPDERGRFLRELNDRRGQIDGTVEQLLEQRRNKEEALAGIEQQEQSGATPPEGTSFSTMRDLVMEDVKDIDSKIMQATRDKVVAEAEYNAVAEKMLDMPKDARQSTPENVLNHLGQSSGVALEQAQAPKSGTRLQSDLEALGMKVVWFRPKEGTFNPAFHTKSTRGVIYLNANADAKAARAYAMEEMFHDIQMFRPDIAAAYMQSAGMESVYRAGVEYAARGRPESAQAARLDEAALGQAIAVAERLAGEQGAIAPTEARRGAARLEQEGAANLFAPAAAALSEAGVVGSFLRTAARLGLSGRQARAAVAVLDTVARSAAVERVQGEQVAPAMSPLARTLLWANDLNISYARGPEGVEAVPVAKAKKAKEATVEQPPMPTKPKAPSELTPFQSEVVSTIGLTPAEARSTVIEYMTGSPGIQSFATGKLQGIKDIVKFLHARRMASGLRTLDLEKAADRKTLSRMLAAEAIAAIKAEGNALTWYDEVIQDMLAKLSVTYPELATEQRARNALIIALAITSQGQNVQDNLDSALRLYEQYRDTVDSQGKGRFPVFGTGKEGAAMRANFKLANEFMDRYGPDLLSRFLRTPFTVKQLRDAGFKIEGEIVSEQVLGSSIFGPKIGFGFMSNLFGNFDPVTMDMWFMRTIGRLMGRLPKFRQDLFDKQMQRLRDSISESGTNGIYSGQFPPELVAAAADPNQPDKAIELATLVTKAHEKDFKVNRAEFDSGERIKTNLVNASATVLSSLSDPNDAPSSGGQRNLLRKVVRDAVALVSSVTGTDITNASFQALIWYPEQYLYNSLGAKLRVIGENYSNAATTLLVKKGIDRGRLDDAVRRSRELRSAGVRGVAVPAVAGATGAVGGQPSLTSPLTPAEQSQFLTDQPGAVARNWQLPNTDRTVDAKVRNSQNSAAGIRFARGQRSGGGTAWSYRPEGGDAGRVRTLKSIRADYVEVFVPGVGLSTVLLRTKNKAPKVYELAAGEKSAAVFHRLITEGKAKNPFGSSVFIYPEADYQSMRLFVTKDGESGFALKPDGDIVSVFSIPGNGEFRGLMETAVAAGGRKLDCFDTVLPPAYAPHGFKAAARLSWSDEQAPPDWDKAKYAKFNNGEPDVVFMARDDSYIAAYEAGDGQRFDDYGAAVAEQEALISFARASDADYLSAVDRGDMGAAQRMVDAAAQAAGYRYRAFHGTDAAFTSFSKDVYPNFANPQEVLGFFFASDREYAQQYGANVINAYVRLTNPKREPASRIDEIENGTVEAAEDYKMSLVDAGHDGIIFGRGEAQELVAFEPQQIKSADPVTRDADGNVIPLSNRFDITTEDISFARAPEDPEVAALKQQIADLQRQIRDVQNVTAAQRANALREVRILQRKLSAAELIASQKVGQAQRAAARAERMATETEEVRAAAEKTISDLTTELDAAEATIRRMRAEARTAASGAEVAALEAKIDRVSNWAYAIGRNEGLLSGQVQGQRQARRTEVAPLQTRVARMSDRIALLTTRLSATRNELSALRQRVRQDAAAAQRAIDFAYDLGLRTGRVQGMMRGRQEMQRRMQRREDALQRRLFDLRELMNTRVEDVTRMRDIVQRMARDAAETLPVRLRGPLATRIAAVRTVAQANRIAVEAMKLAANEEVNQGLATIARIRRQMGRHGMRAPVRERIDAMLAQADAALRQANRRRIRARVETMRDPAGRSMGPAIVNAVAIFAEVANAADLVNQAALAYAADRAAWVAERDARVQRYADLGQRLLANMQGRAALAQPERADRPPRIGILQPIRRANSDIYTMMAEIEGRNDSVINEMLEAAQAGKGASALEHAAIMRQLQPALAAAGYSGLDEYALRNGLMGDASAVTMQVTLGGQPRTLPVGVVMSMAAMDPETLALFGDGQPNNQGIKFRGAETTLTIYPTQQEILAARAALTPGQRGMIDAMKQVLEFQIRDRAMEAIWLVEGDQPPIVPNYWPRIRDTTRFGGEQANVLNQAGALVRGALTSVGFANARTGGREPLVYSDAFRTWDRHLQVALDMIHMAQPYRDAATVLSDRNVMETMDRQNGAGTAEAVMAIFSNGVGATARSSPSIIDALTSNVTGAVLALSPRTWAKIVIGGQIRLSSEIPFGYWTTGVARATAAVRNPADWRARVNEIHALNGYFSRRHNMQFRSIISGALSDQDRVRVLTALEGAANSMRVAGQSVISGQMLEAARSFRDAANGGNLALASLVDALRYMDEQIMLVAVEARLAEVTDEGLLTGQDAMREAALRAERDFRRTQNASDEFDDSSFSATQRVRGNTAWRLLFPFSSDPLKARNQLRRAFVSGEGRLRAVGAVGGNMAASTAIGTMSVATTAYMVSLVASLFGDDDPDEELRKQAAEDAKRIPTSVASEVLSSTMGYTGIVLGQVLQSRQYGRAPLVPVVARPVEQAMREAGQVPEDPVRVIPAMLALSQLAGFPAYQMYRFIEGLAGKSEEPKQPKTPQQQAIERIQRRVKALQSAGQQSR